MTIRQMNFLLALLVAGVFVFSFLMVRGTVGFMTTEHIEAFFFVQLLSLLWIAFSKEKNLRQIITITAGLALGTGIYHLVRQFITSDIDWLIFVAVILGFLVTVLLQLGIRAISNTRASQHPMPEEQ